MFSKNIAHNRFMDETTKRTGPALKFPEAMYLLAYELYRVAGLSAPRVAESINAKEIGPRIDGTQVKNLAKIGARITQEGK
jgi:hypothetical protein